METTTLGRVLVTAKIENLQDLHNVETGALSPDRVRAIEVTDALVDTGASGLGLPKTLAVQLGLKPGRTRQARTSAGAATFQMYGAVRFTIQGREGVCDVTGLPDNCSVLIGQIPLELLDFVVDPIGQRLIGNPEHGGEHQMDMY